MFGFCQRKGLGENVGSHISSRTEDKFELARFDSKTNKMETDVNMFSVGVIAVILGKCDGGHVVRMKWKRDGVEIAENFLDKILQPNRFLGCIGDSDVFGFSSGKGDEFLTFGRP